MYLSTRFRVRALGALGAATGLATLSGCQNHKIVARVNGTPINDDEYQTFVSHVRAPDFTALTAQGVQTDAGGAGMASVVKEKLLEKLATEKNALPNDDAVTQYQDYVMHTNPAFPTAIAMGQVTTEELHRIIRDQMILVALGTNNANVPEDEIKKEFDAHKDQYNYPEMVGLQVAPVPDQTTGIELINQIRSTGDFGKSAAKYSPQATVVRYIVVNERFPAPLKDALAPLKDNQLAPAPIAIPNPSGGSANIVVKLVKRMPKQDVTLAQAHQAVVQRRLQETQPQLLQHSQEVINEYNQKATVEVLVDQYKSVVTSALMPPPVSPMGMGGSGQGGAMAPGAGGPAAGGPGVPRRVMPRMGAGIPRQSSGAPAPNGGTAAPTPNAHP